MGTMVLSSADSSQLAFVATLSIYMFMHVIPVRGFHSTNPPRKQLNGYAYMPALPSHISTILAATGTLIFIAGSSFSSSYIACS